MEARDEQRPVPAFRALAGMLTNPGATFAAFPAKQPWFVPLLLFGLIGAVTGGLSAPEAAELAAQQAAEVSQQAGLPAGEIDRVVQLARTAAVATGIAAGLFGPALQVFITTIVVWVITLLLRQRMPFAQLFSLTTHAYVPHVFSTVLVTALVASGVYDIFAMQGAPPTSLGAMFPDTAAGFLKGLLNRIELFTLWSTVLLGLGLTAATHRTSRWGMGTAFAAWLLMALVGSALFALGSAAGNLPGSLPGGAMGGPGLGGGIPR